MCPNVCGHLIATPICEPFPYCCHEDGSTHLSFYAVVLQISFTGAKGLAQTCSSMKMPMCTMWVLWRHGWPKLEWKNSSGVRRALTSTLFITLEMNWYSRAPGVLAWHQCPTSLVFSWPKEQKAVLQSPVENLSGRVEVYYGGLTEGSDVHITDMGVIVNFWLCSVILGIYNRLYLVQAVSHYIKTSWLKPLFSLLGCLEIKIKILL